MSENNDTSNDGSDSILQASRQTSNANNPAVLRTGVLRPAVLGHSTLSAAVNNSGEDADKPKDEVVVCNPFMREQKDEHEDTSEEDKSAAGGGAATATKDSKDVADEGAAAAAAAVTDSAANAGDTKKPEDDEEADERPDPLTMLRNNGRTSLFAAAKSAMPRVEKSGFVFGQNVHERVTGENSSKSENADGVGSASGELLFSSVIQNAAQAKSNESEAAAAAGGGGAAKEAEPKSLNDVAREYEESRAQKRKYDEVETFTGEEDEKNIVDINCKFFAFGNSNWEERGRGCLRLNDSKEEQCSRVVFRTSGNLRLLLNTKVWAGMVAERASQKAIRVTAMDNTGQIKVYLLMARPTDITLLYKALVERIDLRKISHPEECRATDEEKNGDAAKNGTAAALHVDEAVETAAVLAVPIEQDDSVEPSPKKSLHAE